MILATVLRLLRNEKCLVAPAQYAVQTNSYAILAKKSTAKKPGPKKIVLPVEKDVNKLVNYVCGSNIYKEGEDIKIKPDSEYPDWLWSIRMGPPPALEELDPNSKQYWRKVRRIGMKTANQMRSHKKFY